MCKLVLRIRYRAASESPQLITFETEDEMQARIADLQKLDTVASVQVFRLSEVVQRVEQWETRSEI